MRDAVAITACLALSCGRAQGISDRDLGGLVVAETRQPRPIGLDRAVTDPEELGRALAVPHHEIVALLGEHAISIEMTTRVTENGNAISSLDETTAMERGDHGAFHAVYANSQDYGKEVNFIDGKVYLRPRYQRWHVRDPAPANEPVVLADQFYDPIYATWELFSPGVSVSDKGSAQFAGRTGRAIAIGRAASPRRPTAEPLAHRKWREQRTIEAITGDIVLDEQRGVPLAVNLSGTVRFQRDGRNFAMQISLHSAVAKVGQAAQIAPPTADEVVATPERMREVDDRDFLLQGIAPPVHRPRNGPSDKPAAQGEAAP